MPPTFRPPTLGAKTPPRAIQGKVQSSTTLVRKDRDGDEQELRSDHSVVEVPGVTGSGLGTVGCSLGLTIPGPRGSYMSARADVWVYLPTDGSEESSRQVAEKARTIAQEALDEAAQVAVAYLNALLS